MNDEDAIHEILITRDVRAFTDGDWEATAADFAQDFTAYSAAGGDVRLAYPRLESYRDEWLRQAAEFAGVDRDPFAGQLEAAQHLERIEIAGDRALATKVFDGAVDGPDGSLRLDWTTHYFLRRDGGRWLITGFVGYVPTGGVR